jgi:Transmembrane domain of unknown function (DUF3566)
MDGGRAIPPGESERPTRIIPPLPATPQPGSKSRVNTVPRVPLKERFAKVFSTGGSESTSEGSVNGTVPPSVSPNGAAAFGDSSTVEGAARNGVAAASDAAANGATRVTTTPPTTRSTSPVLPPPAPVKVKPPKARKSRSQPAGASAPPPVASAVPVAPPPATRAPVTQGTQTQPPVASPAQVGSKQPRRARLRLTRVDPWSVMKTAFLLSVAFGIVTVSSVLIVWSVLGAAGVWDSVNQSVKGVIGDTAGSSFNIEDYIGTDRVLGFTALVAVIDVVLLTAIATLSAFLYNMAAALLGGLEVTLAEDS